MKFLAIFCLIFVAYALADETNPCDEAAGVVGTCRAAKPSYTYKKDLNQCSFFLYGGCEGNANRFLTKEACEAQCVH